MWHILSVVVFTNDLAARLHEPGAVRFLVQPVAAALFAVVDGVRDARAGRPAFLMDAWRGGARSAHRRRGGLVQLVSSFAIAAAIDVMLQWITLREIHLGAGFLLGAALICLPYILLRGPVNRVLSWRPRHEASTR